MTAERPFQNWRSVIATSASRQFQKKRGAFRLIERCRLFSRALKSQAKEQGAGWPVARGRTGPHILSMLAQRTCHRRDSTPHLGCGPARKNCRSPGSNGDTLDALVADYLRRYAPDAAGEELFFGTHDLDVEGAAARAALSVDQRGRLHSHQWRLGRELTKKMALVLQPRAKWLAMSTSFDELLTRIEALFARMHRVGELAAYDVAHRLGAYLGLAPERVYLHAGTRAGALALGLDHRARSIGPEGMPSAMRRLTPAQVEDFLCVYKANFGRLKQL